MRKEGSRPVGPEILAFFARAVGEIQLKRTLDLFGSRVDLRANSPMALTGFLPVNAGDLPTAPSPAPDSLTVYMLDRPPHDMLLLWNRLPGWASGGGTAVTVYNQLECALLAPKVFGSGLSFFHGAVVAKGGQALAMIGPNRSGKSTLMASLLGHGYSFLGDDIIAFDPRSRVAHPTPFAPILRRPALTHLGPLARGFVPFDDGWLVLRPPRLKQARGPLPLRTLVLLEGFADETRTAPASHTQAIPTIAKAACFGDAGRLPFRDTVRNTLGLLEAVGSRVFRAVAGRPAAAARAMIALHERREGGSRARPCPRG